MRMNRAPVVLAVVLLAACDSAVGPTRAIDLRISETNGAADNYLAFGLANAELPAGFGLATLEFHAVHNSNGSAHGSFRMTRSRNGLTSDIEGAVTCLSIDAANNRAWIGGVVTANNSTDPNQQLEIHQPGRDVWFRVVDGGKDGIDRTTILGFQGAIVSSLQYCTDRPWTAGDVNTFPVVAGDIKVKD